MKRRHILITGGAGFVGSNLADSFLQEGHSVVIFDTLARRGVEANFEWLAERHGIRMRLDRRDVRDAAAVEDAVKGAAAIFHFAAQVAVTSSLAEPQADFSVNAQGTLNLIEAVRRRAPQTPVIFASTNKVYGHLRGVELIPSPDGFVPADDEIRRNGISETQPLDLATPYGCSKGVADQYVLDYARSFGLRTAVLRMSCIYGPRQFGTEDQGWVAHFLIRALAGEAITIYGTGRQMRDVLHVSDAVSAYRGVLDNIDKLKGRAFNLGGGPDNAVSLLTMLREMSIITGGPLDICFSPARPGDQDYFVSDTVALQRATGWQPTLGWREGVRNLASWLRDHPRPVVEIPAALRRAIA